MNLYIDGVPVPTRHTAMVWSGRTKSGYGRRIPTEYLVFVNNRWHRVYCAIWSNSGTCYIGRSLATGMVVNG